MKCQVDYYHWNLAGEAAPEHTWQSQRSIAFPGVLFFGGGGDLVHIVSPEDLSMKA